MKKVLALVLAVMMLATVAFAAADVTNPGDGSTDFKRGTVLPGKTIAITAEGIHDRNDSYKFLDSSDPDAKYDANDPADKLLKDLNSTNYSITAFKYNDGKAMITGYGFNDTKNQVEIKLKKDFSLTKPVKLNVTFTLKGKKVGKTKPADIDVEISKTINFELNKGLQISDDNELKIDGSTSFNEDYVYEIQKSTNGEKQGTMEFTTADGDVDVEVRVYSGDKLYLYNTVEADTDILKAYADADADLSFLTFKGEPTFNSTATVRFYKEEGTYVYGVKDGKVVNVNAKWSDDEGAFILKTRTLGAYVFSDKKLSVSTPAAGSENPDTGANDVVGIATALAAVALVSAAAVSLKK